MIFLLDVNALLAYHYPKHVHHARVRAWVSQLRAERGPDDVALTPERDLPAWVRKPAHTTDGYLLALAKTHGGHLATLDESIPGALLIPGETSAPLTVREERALQAWTTPLRTGTHTDPRPSAMAVI